MQGAVLEATEVKLQNPGGGGDDGDDGDDDERHASGVTIIDVDCVGVRHRHRHVPR